MIIVAGEVLIRPEKREEAISAALAMAQATEAEPGCLSYRFYTDVADPNRILIFEQWETAEALAAHFQTSHMALFQKQIPQFVAEPPSIKRYEVAKVLDI